MHQDGFSWSENLFMELGRMQAYNLENNERAEGFWVNFLLLSGIGMAILHLMWMLNMRVHQARLWAGAAFLLVGLGAFHSYGLRLYPFDTAYFKFLVFWERMAAGYALGAVATGIAMKIEPECKSLHSYAWWSAGLLALIQWSLLKWGPEMWRSHWVLTTHAILEKVVFVAYVAVWIVHLRLRYNKLRGDTPN